MLHEALPVREDAEFRLKSWMEIFYEVGADLLWCLRRVQKRSLGQAAANLLISVQGGSEPDFLCGLRRLSRP